MAKEIIISPKLLAEAQKSFNERTQGDDALKEIATSSELLPAKALNKVGKLSVTDRILTELEKKTEALKINGIEDKEGYAVVKAWRLAAKKIRTTGVKHTKAGRADALEIQNAWLKIEKDFEARVAKTEDRLEKMEDEYDLLVKAEQQRKDNELNTKFGDRILRLSEFKVDHDKVNNIYSLGEVQFDGSIIREGDDDIFEEIFSEFKAESDKITSEKLEEERANLIEQQKELRGARKTLLESVKATLPEDDLGEMKLDDWNALYSAAKNDFDTKQNEQAEQAKEDAKKKLIERIDSLRELGFVHDNDSVVFFRVIGDRRESIELLDETLAKMDDVDFKLKKSEVALKVKEIEKDLEDEEKAAQERKDKATAIRTLADSRMKMLTNISVSYKGDDLGIMPDEEWETRYAIAKTAYDKREKERMDEEFKTKNDKEQWKRFIEQLSTVSLPAPNGKTFKAKLAQATILLNQIKEL